MLGFELTLGYGIELFAIIACACYGAAHAVRADLGLFGTVLLSECCAVGGGLIRDLVLGVEPVAFNVPGYFVPPALVGVVVFWVCCPVRERQLTGSRWLEMCDAVGLAVFSVTGAVKALDHGASLPTAVALGTLNGVGGGILCGVLTGETPAVLRWGRHLYAAPCALGAFVVGMLQITGQLTAFGLIASVIVAFGLRLVALFGDLRSPRSLLWSIATADARRRHRRLTAAGAVPAPQGARR